jgi:hypothetical protein
MHYRLWRYIYRNICNGGFSLHEATDCTATTVQRSNCHLGGIGGFTIIGAPKRTTQLSGMPRSNDLDSTVVPGCLDVFHMLAVVLRLKASRDSQAWTHRRPTSYQKSFRCNVTCGRSHSWRPYVHSTSLCPEKARAATTQEWPNWRMPLDRNT